MEYPVSNTDFNKLLQTREQMIGLDSSSSDVLIAWPFVPFIGSSILKGTPGVYFIGIATRGSWSRSRDLAKGRKISCDHVRNANSSTFWRYLRALSKAVFGQPFPQCIEKIAWSNQFKIGVRNGNPSGTYAKVQQDISRSILE